MSVRAERVWCAHPAARIAWTWTGALPKPGERFRRLRRGVCRSCGRPMEQTDGGPPLATAVADQG